ncbi:MAG TPA: lauroyl acyltransferase [Magnetospirillum sp.]|nr:lauroyl acyltransferase [Magnetospirillum sp.]
MKLISKPARQRLEAIAAHALLGLFRLLPVDAASGLAGGIARLIGPRLKVSNVARRNLARAFPDKSAAEIETIVAEVWDNLGRVVGEFPHIKTLLAERVEVVGIENVRLMRDDGKCGLFVSAHFGNWEIAGAVAAREGFDLTLVYRAANNPWIEELYRRHRADAGAHQIPKGAEGAKQIMAVMKAGGHVAMLVDQKMNDGIAVPFFGRDAMTAPAVAKFAHKFDCPVVMLKTERLGGARFRITFYPPTHLPTTGVARADTLAAMTAINRTIEDWIRDRPGQWLWLHKRWPE